MLHKNKEHLPNLSTSVGHQHKNPLCLKSCPNLVGVPLKTSWILMLHVKKKRSVTAFENIKTPGNIFCKQKKTGFFKCMISLTIELTVMYSFIFLYIRTEEQKKNITVLLQAVFQIEFNELLQALSYLNIFFIGDFQ